MKSSVFSIILVSCFLLACSAFALTSNEKKVFEITFIEKCNSGCEPQMKSVLEKNTPNYKIETLNQLTEKCLKVCQCDIEYMPKYVSD